LSKTGVLGWALACLAGAALACSEARSDGTGDPPAKAPPAAAEPLAAPAAQPPVAGDGELAVGPFSSAGGKLPAGWAPLEFPKIPEHTRYTLEPSEGGWVVRAQSRASASGLIRNDLAIDLREHPILSWRWKVDNLIAKSDPTAKAGDDYAARIYIAFRYEPARVPLLRKAKFKAAQIVFGDIPIGAINYIWATATPVGSILDNPYAGDFVKMIPVQCGSGSLGQSVAQQRNVYEDYKRAFGAEPPLVEGVAIMTDTDNTSESASASYGDIRFLRAAAN
jgi:hypothetical protein